MRFRALVLIALSVPGWAQQEQKPIEEQEILRVGVTSEERRLTLTAAIEMALKNNLAIEIERANVDTAAQITKAARGVFDPILRYTPGLETRNTPTASVLISPTGKLTEHVHTENASYIQKTPWRGVSFKVDWDNGRQSTNNPFSGLTPYTTSRLNMGFSAPLWRNGEIDRERAEIRIRRKREDVSMADFERRVIDTTTQVQNVYWDLVATLREREVLREAVRLGREQLARTQRQIESGTLAPVELAASEAELQRRIDSFVASVNRVTQAENGLKTLLASSRDEPLWNQQLLPVDQKPLDVPFRDLGKIVVLGLERRPEMKAVKLLNDVNEIQTKVARNQTKPQVNLTGNYIIAGLAGQLSEAENPIGASSAAQLARLNELSVFHGLTPIPPFDFGGAPASLLGGYGQTLKNMFGGSYYTLSAGVQLEWNPRNRAAESELAQTAIAERRLKLQQRQVEQVIEAEVRNALQALDSAEQRIKATDASAKAAQEKLESEIRLFQTGESTNFLVLTRQNELLDSQLRSVLAVLDYNKAIARLEQVTATTLERHSISLQ